MWAPQAVTSVTHVVPYLFLFETSASDRVNALIAFAAVILLIFPQIEDAVHRAEQGGGLSIARCGF